MNPAAFAKAILTTTSDAVEARIARVRAEAGAPATQSPAQIEKDKAIALARIAARDGRAINPQEVTLIAQQLLRALGLS